MLPSLCGLLVSISLTLPGIPGQTPSPDNAPKPSPEAARYAQVSSEISRRGLSELGAYALLAELTGKIGARLSGSPQAAAAVEWGRKTMLAQGFENVHLEPVRVPHWVRGRVEQATLLAAGDGPERKLAVCALGGSVATPKDGITAEVVEVQSLAEARGLGEWGKGKIVFFNRPFDPTLVNTFAAYGGAVDQRYGGASAAAASGAVAVLVRSMTLAKDDVPHTGAMGYEANLPKIPAAALSAQAADALSARLKQGGAVRVRLKLDCRTLPEVDSANVVGELVGSEKPNEVIVMGGHLDSWDKGVGAHDDGAGCSHSLEALSLLKRAGLRPKRTIRVVLFMNEENGGAGGLAYAAMKRTEGERHIAAIESDSGGFAPRGFGVSARPEILAKFAAWMPVLEPFGADKLLQGGGGSDVEPLGAQGVPTIGLEPESQRYFDYHHSNNDTLDKVNPRELELGAISLALLAYMISEEGL
jgi:carboxypeptidase Q